MQKSHVQINEIKLIGITARTSNTLEMDMEKAKIGPTIKKYFENNLCALISNRLNPATTYCVYTDYESNQNGMYTYFIGEEVHSFESVPANFKTLVIPSQDYIKFNVGPGAMPNVCIHAWKAIWKMKQEELGGKRAFIADFEIYDKRAKDYQNTILDIYIGIQHA